MEDNHLTEQMIRKRLDILSSLNLVVITRGPKGSRITLLGEKLVDNLRTKLPNIVLKKIWINNET